MPNVGRNDRTPRFTVRRFAEIPSGRKDQIKPMNTLPERAREHAPKNRRQPPGFASPRRCQMWQQRLEANYLEHLIAEAEAEADDGEDQAAMSSS